MSTILFAKTIQDLLYQVKTNNNLTIVGGCTNTDKIPERFISTRNIPELNYIERHERYIDIGPGTTLSQILQLGQNHLPQILYEALHSIATPIIRNIATIGGNICSEGQRYSLFAPLMALDTKVELKSTTDTKIESIQNFKKIPDGYILSNIRIPLIIPEVCIFRRIGPENLITPESATFAFMADTENNTLNDIRFSFSGPFVFRNRTFESSLVGYRLPLTRKDISDIQSRIEEEFKIAAIDQMISDTVKQQFINLCRYSLEQLM